MTNDASAQQGPGSIGRRRTWAALAGGLTLGACNPTVRVEAPDKPIEINLNVRIDHEVRVRVERELEQVFENNPDIF